MSDGRTWQVLVISVAVSVIGFLSIHRYNPAAGLLWNVLHGEIHLTEACDQPGVPPDFSRFAINPDTGRPADEDQPWPRRYCNLKLQYSWLLSAVVAFAAIGLLWPRRATPRKAPAARTTQYEGGAGRYERAFWLVKWLGTLSVGCVILLILIGTPGFGVRNGRAIGEATGAGFLIFIISSFVAGVTARIIQRSHVDQYETPLIYGILTAILITGLVWLGASGGRLGP